MWKMYFYKHHKCFISWKIKNEKKSLGFQDNLTLVWTLPSIQKRDGLNISHFISYNGLLYKICQMKCTAMKEKQMYSRVVKFSKYCTKNSQTNYSGKEWCLYRCTTLLNIDLADMEMQRLRSKRMCRMWNICYLVYY